MTAAAILTLQLLTAGDASYYAPGVMEATVAYRLDRAQMLPCPACVGYVALLDCRHIGRLVWLDWGLRGGIEGPFTVADCAQAEHRAGLAKRGRAVEVDYDTALRHRMAGPVPVRVLWQPPETCTPSQGAC